MKHLKSFQENRPAVYLISTPIGNLDDITLRAINTLKAVDLIYAEDTRTSGVLLKHYDIKTPLVSYHAHNEKARLKPILNKLKEEKNIALISDAGTPLISDPGQTLVKSLIEHDYPVISIPGPSAFLSALTVSGYTHPFLFYGFLPSKAPARNQVLESMKTLPYTLIFYEAPHRLKETLESLKTVFISRDITIARELTKLYEETIHLTLEDIDQLPPLKGELVLVVEGFTDETPMDEKDLIDHIELLISDGLSEMDAIKAVAKARNMKKNDVYMAYHTHKKYFKEDKGV